MLYWQILSSTETSSVDIQLGYKMHPKVNSAILESQPSICGMLYPGGIGGGGKLGIWNDLEFTF